jgi:D-tyrosyl-tRNA(Tyr) deacylase
MRALVQRVSRGGVAIAGVQTAAIARGFVILLGIRKGDSSGDARYLAEKCARLRVMEDGGGRMNLALGDVGGQALVVSQFTLYGDAHRGNRPGFSDAAPPEEALPLYEEFVRTMREHLGASNVCTGDFGAMMEISIVNDGPVTILIESPTQHQTRSATT